jgi:biopolymer transport protein ExbB
MEFFSEASIAMERFFDMGGPVLYAIFVVLLLMWGLILERFWYLRAVFPAEATGVIQAWDSRRDTTSWYAGRIRDAMIADVHQNLHRNLLLIKTLIALCPLLGLLGTVTGMISVFDVMAVAGTSNARAMAGGVSRATVPTMSGMVAALSGMYFSVRLQQRADMEADKLEDSLQHH